MAEENSIVTEMETATYNTIWMLLIEKNNQRNAG